METVHHSKEIKKFEGRRIGITLYLLIIVIGILLVPLFIESEKTLAFWLIQIPLFGSLVLLIWPLMVTHYTINGFTLNYRSGFIKGKIDIRDIRVIHDGKTAWWGTRPALTTKGMLIHYNKYDRLYIAPVEQGEMINTLIKINPER